MYNVQTQHIIKITAAGGSGIVYCFVLTMERLFSPCTRMHDIFEIQGRLEEFRDHREGLQELNLDVSTDEFLSAERAFTCEDLCAMLGNRKTIAWLTPHAAVMHYGTGMYYWGQLDDSWRSVRFHADGKEIFALARSPEHLLEICDVVLRLLAASVVHSVMLQKFGSRHGDNSALINSPTLEYLTEQCQSLKALTLQNLEMNENHCRVLGTYSRPGLEIELQGCKLTRAGASALADVLERNQGPTKLAYCDIDYSVLADGLRGNSRLKSLTTRSLGNLEVGNRELLAIAGALRENKGLVELDLSYCSFSDETWGVICDSLKTHPTLEVLDLRAANNYATTAPDVITSWVQALLDMMNINVSIHTIHLDSRYSQHEIYRESVIPYLETNRLRSRVLAIQKTLPITHRAKVLGRALVAVRTDANSFWMLLSGNPEIAFPSTTATTTLAANIPTHATVATVADTADTVTATRAASTTGASAAAYSKAQDPSLIPPGIYQTLQTCIVDVDY
jgi:hypothetical protein